jgi:succinate dehydrogenase / fumarate reductase cytochrome b subunit
MAAHTLQRITGLGLLVYLFLHVRTIHELSKGPEAFDSALALFRNPLFKLGEIALLGAVILHALNGLRITMLDMGIANDKQKQLFWGLSVAGAGALFLLGAIPMFLFAVLKVR